MKQYNGEKYIVSFTSFGPRIEMATKMVFNLTKQTYKNFHLVMTIYKDDVKNIGEKMKLFIDNNLLELIIADEDLGPHTKYYYAMKKYYDMPIITLDDDRIYCKDTIAQLVEKYESLDYKSVVSRCAIKMQKTNDNKIIPYTGWIRYRLQKGEKSYIAMAEGFCGILYPPQCFKNLLSDEFKNGIFECKYDDDLYLKIQGIENKIPVTQANYKLTTNQEIENIREMMKYNLHENQNKGETPRNNLCYKFSKELLKGFDLC